jgi:adenylyltransferase/sulfurtransferase
MDDIGPEGQAALLDSAVLVVGAGGLGSPVIQYLAAAGLGQLGIADPDIVERSNLQRQTIHGSADIGRRKVESAAEFVGELNADITVNRHELRVTAEVVTDLIADYDVVVDASDNFPTRFLLNDACVLADKPLSHGAVYRFEGQATTFTGGQPCYRCLFPEAPPEGSVPNCATAGVLGAVPGTVGAIQATEVVKLLVGYGKTLEERFLIYESADMTMETVPLETRPDCPVCGTGGLESLSEATYAEDCAVPE